tara:strand:+ start:1063 stop:1368 length:306 start_codon:yes stop_codon:yes gene_type:complete
MKVEFLPTKSKRQNREFEPPTISGPNTKYGFCHYTQRWVRRDTMLGINVRFYNDDNEQKTVRLRLSPEGWNELYEKAVEADWENVLRTRDELEAEGTAYVD